MDGFAGVLSRSWNGGAGHRVACSCSPNPVGIRGSEHLPLECLNCGLLLGILFFFPPQQVVTVSF